MSESTVLYIVDRNRTEFVMIKPCSIAPPVGADMTVVLSDLTSLTARVLDVEWTAHERTSTLVITVMLDADYRLGS